MCLKLLLMEDICLRLHASHGPCLNDTAAWSDPADEAWDALLAENKGKIDVAAAQRFLGDHYDTFAKKTEPSERTLCGHIELSRRGDDL